MNKPEMTPEEIELAIAGIKIFNKGSKMISIDTLDALYKWGEYWDYYREFLMMNLPKPQQNANFLQGKKGTR